MDKQREEKLDCTDEQIRSALARLARGSGGYSQFFSALAKGGMGLRTPNGGSIIVCWKDGLVTAKLLHDGPDATDTLDRFFTTLKGMTGAIKVHEASKPVAKPASVKPATRPTGISKSTSHAGKGIIAKPQGKPHSQDTESHQSTEENLSAGLLSKPVTSLTERVMKMSAGVSKAVATALSKMIPVRLVLIISFAVLLVSALVGGGVGYAMRNPVEQPEYVQMVKEKDGDISDLNIQVSAAEEKVESLQPYKDDYDKKQQALTDQKTELETQKAELDKQKSDQEAKQKELDQKSSELDKRSSDLDSRESAVQQRENAVASIPSSTDSGSSGYSASGTSSDSGASGSAYYKNCAAARAAGAAPLYRGQPGYRSALDRDNDGIACEWS